MSGRLAFLEVSDGCDQLQHWKDQRVASDWTSIGCACHQLCLNKNKNTLNPKCTLLNPKYSYQGIMWPTLRRGGFHQFSLKGLAYSK